MGCGTCRISEVDTEFFRSCRNNTISILDFDAYLTVEERKYWINQLAIDGIPETEFWSEFQNYTHSSFTQISKDINRTFPTIRFFSSKPNVDRFQLLLRKFAIYFPRIGYTQGLNFIAGYLLLCGFNDDQAFKILVGLMVHEGLFAIGLYEDQFPLNRLYCEVFWNLLDLRMPKVAQKIRKAKVPDQIWIFQWFISFFLYSFPTEYVKRWWNFNIWKKEMAMVLIALGIVKCLKAEILSMKNPDEFDFIQLFENTKEIAYCESKIDSKKLTSFINSFTFQEIERAIQDTKCHSNPYRKYFLTPPYERKQLYIKLMKHFKYERTCFRVNPDPKKYSRNQAATNHLEDLMLSKYKLYQSEFKRSSVSNSMFKMSTFSINIQNDGHIEDPNRQNQSNPFSRDFLRNINFTQSKVFNTNLGNSGFQFGNMKERKNDPNSGPKPNSPFLSKKPVSPFEDFSEKQTQNIGGKYGPRQYPDFSKKSKPKNANF